MEPITIAIAGCGSRGMDAYASAIEQMPGRARIVAAADLNPVKLAVMRERFGVPAQSCFAWAEEMLRQDRLAKAVLICTPDNCHYAHARAALEKGYHLLLEKPISPSVEQLEDLERLARERGRLVVVCHVLRYTPLYQAVKRVIDSGELGEIQNLEAQEMVGHWHFAHSYVRGNWRRSEDSSPMILAKCCHDMDILVWLAGRRCTRVSSFGGLGHFRAENAPESAPERCTDGCTVACPYDARRIYLGGLSGRPSGWPANVITSDLRPQSVLNALQTGPYGRCVYRCDNDVADHQAVNLELEGGMTASFSVSAFSLDIDRRLKVMGTLGELTAHLKRNHIHVQPFVGEGRDIDVNLNADDQFGHGGGDIRLMDAFLAALEGAEVDMGTLSTLEVSVESHRIALTAEESRRNGGQVVAL